MSEYGGHQHTGHGTGTWLAVRWDGCWGCPCFVTHWSQVLLCTWPEQMCAMDSMGRERAGTLLCARCPSSCVGLWSLQKMEQQEKTKGQVIQTNVWAGWICVVVAWASLLLGAVTNMSKSIHRWHGVTEDIGIFLSSHSTKLNFIGEILCWSRLIFLGTDVLVTF